MATDIIKKFWDKLSRRHDNLGRDDSFYALFSNGFDKAKIKLDHITRVVVREYDEETLKKIEEIQRIIDRDYLYVDDIDREAIQDAIFHGYVAGLKEPYSVYYSAEEAKALFETTSGTFGGIGVYLGADYL